MSEGERPCQLCQRVGHKTHDCPTYYETDECVIKSVVAAQPGTRAVFRGAGKVWFRPVLLWATYSKRYVRRFRDSGTVFRRFPWKRGEVSGMCELEWLELCDQDAQFVSYLAPGEELTAAWFEERELEVPEQYNRVPPPTTGTP